MPRVTITVPEKNAQPYRFQLDREVVNLGRGSENDIVIDCGSISVKHAEMCRVKGGYELRDIGSTNGIKLNDERREVIRLRNGVAVKLGDVEFDFLLNDEELEALAAEKPERGDDEEKSAMDLPPLEEEPEAFDPDDDDDDEAGGGGNAAMIILFIVLAIAAAFAGMAVRFQKETGGSLFDAIKGKGVETSAPAEGAGAKPE